MNFRIADTFTDSLTRLTNEEQKAVKTTAFDLQLNPANPGMQFHRLERVKDKNFWSVRANRDIRLIVHRTQAGLLLCYVGHHDDAYAWAARRKLETHPSTGAAQLVKLPETVQPARVVRESPAVGYGGVFARYPDAELLSYGVPEEWLPEVHRATEDTVLELAEQLPKEAAEALLDLAVGKRPVVATPAQGTDPFQHPDALRRFRLVQSEEELARALDYPWDRWTIFLHPAQRQTVERDYTGPARVSGTAGTGKTIVALHRAVHLARGNPDARVLLTTFSPPLASALDEKLRRLASPEPQIAERVEVHAIESIALRLYERNFGRPVLAGREQVRQLVTEAAHQAGGVKFTPAFLLAEWEQVVDAWQIDTWEEYRDVARLGRKMRLPEKQREALWTVFAQVGARLQERGWVTLHSVYSRLATHFAKAARSPFEFVVVDEAQDVGISQMRFLAALAAERPNSLFLAGDIGQRIFQQPFSWKSLGVDVRGRSSTLRINYRTSHQIRAQADRLLAPQLSDVDGNVEQRQGAISVFNGPDPVLKVLNDEEEEAATVAAWLRERIADGVQPQEIGVFVRSDAELDRARAAATRAELPFRVLDENVRTAPGHLSISTMHLAKGLEFRTVAVMACDDEVIPSQERIESVTDEADLEDVFETERHLLYVACTRARDHLLVTSAGSPSEYLDDLAIKAP
jgi:superfamily I DNA/RNA helicase/mRNA-degrading endonuclease RelE of RelBE toxin-antitoxin system